MKDPHDIIRRPIITEKSSIERETYNVVTFAVNPRAGKVEIKQAVEALFNVRVLGVHTSRVRGKLKRVGQKAGRRPAWKKARVRLESGDTIEFFEGV